MIKYYPCITAPGLKGKERERDERTFYLFVSLSLENQSYKRNVVLKQITKLVLNPLLVRYFYLQLL